MLVWLSAAIARASRVKRSVNWALETLIATSRFKRGIVRAIHLAHATFADESKDFVGAEFVAYRKRHRSDAVKFSRSKSGLRLGDGVS